VRQEKGVSYSGCEAHMVKLSKQPLASFGPNRVTWWVKRKQLDIGP